VRGDLQRPPGQLVPGVVRQFTLWPQNLLCQSWSILPVITCCCWLALRLVGRSASRRRWIRCIGAAARRRCQSWSCR